MREREREFGERERGKREREKREGGSEREVVEVVFLRTSVVCSVMKFQRKCCLNNWADFFVAEWVEI